MSHLGTYQRYVAKQADSAVGAGLAIPELTGIGVSGADGERQFLCEVTITAGKALNFYSVHVGPLGTQIDPILHLVAAENRNLNEWQTQPSGLFELVVPATGAPIVATDLVTIGVSTWAGGLNNVIAGAAGVITGISAVWIGEYLQRRGALY